MKNAFLIFFSDLKAICSHFFSLVILGAVLVIPALYAWVNIYANWDPYGNTGNIPIALASRDTGYITKEGEYVNKGSEIVEEVSRSTRSAGSLWKTPTRPSKGSNGAIITALSS